MDFIHVYLRSYRNHCYIQSIKCTKCVSKPYRDVHQNLSIRYLYRYVGKNSCHEIEKQTHL